MTEPGPGPYEGKTDEQVLAIAQAAHRRAGALPSRSHARRAEWNIFDKAMGELLRRAMSHVLGRIEEMEAAGDLEVPDPGIAETIISLIDRNRPEPPSM